MGPCTGDSQPIAANATCEPIVFLGRGLAASNIRSLLKDDPLHSRRVTALSKRPKNAPASEIDASRRVRKAKGMPSVLTVGDINADIVAVIPHYPEKGGEGLSEKGEMHGGGSAANTAIVVARFGVGASLLARVGTDPLGEYVFRELEKAGVDLTLVQRDPTTLTGTMFVTVMPDGERTMLGHRGANVNLTSASVANIAWSDLRWVHVSGYALLKDPQRATALRVFEHAVKRTMTVSLDVGMYAACQAGDEVRNLLPQASVLFQNLEEARALTGKTQLVEASKALLKKGVGTVVVKLGKDGCAVADGKESLRVPAFHLNVVDSTGAGDSFDAGFILGRQWGLSLRASALLGNALGGLACTVMGAGERLPKPQEALELIRRGLSDPALKSWTQELELLLKTLERFPKT